MMISSYFCNEALESLYHLLERCLDNDKRVAVVCETQMIRTIDDFIWTYSQYKFMPHCTIDDAFKHDNPIIITDNVEENHNNATIIMFFSGYKANIRGSVVNNHEKALFLFYKSKVYNPTNETAPDTEGYISYFEKHMLSHPEYAKMLQENQKNTLIAVQERDKWYQYPYNPSR